MSKSQVFLYNKYLKNLHFTDFKKDNVVCGSIKKYKEIPEGSGKKWLQSFRNDTIVCKGNLRQNLTKTFWENKKKRNLINKGSDLNWISTNVFQTEEITRKKFFPDKENISSENRTRNMQQIYPQENHKKKRKMEEKITLSRKKKSITIQRIFSWKTNKNTRKKMTFHESC